MRTVRPQAPRALRGPERHLGALSCAGDYGSGGLYCLGFGGSGSDRTDGSPSSQPLLRGKSLVDGAPAVCRDYACEAPITYPETLRAKLAIKA